MILDKELELSNNQAITVSAKSTNTIDLGGTNWAGTSRGGGDEVPLVPTVEETFTAAGAATLTIGIRTSAASDMTGAVVRSQTAAIPVAELTAGADLRKYFDALRLPDQALRYVDAFYTVATGPFTAGKLSLRGAASRHTNK